MSKQQEEPTEKSERRPELFGSLLDVFSSHPYWLKRSSTWVAVVVVGPVLVAYIAAIGLWLSHADVVDLVEAVISGLHGAWVWPVAGIFFVLGALLAIRLRLAAATYQAERGFGESKGRLSIPTTTAVAIVGIGFPLLAALLNSLPAEVRIGLLTASVIPLLGLFVMFGIARPRTTGFPWSRLLKILGWFFGLTVLGHSVERFLPEWIYDRLPRLAEPLIWAKIAGLLVVPYLLLGIIDVLQWLEQRRRLPAKSSESKPEDQSTERPDAAALANLLREHLNKDQAPKIDAITLDTKCSEPVNGDDPMSLAGLLRTRDQTAAVGRFLDMLATADQDDEDTLILEGVSGSGRSSTLDALAALSAGVAGLQVAYLVPDDRQVTLTLERLRNRLAPAIRWGAVRCGASEELVRYVAADGEASDLPDICVMTPQDWEELCSPAITEQNSDETFRRRIRIALLFSVMVIDDWVGMTAELASHIPFLIEKRRMLADAHRTPCLHVLSLPELEPGGWEILESRLFASTDDAANHRLHLRPLELAQGRGFAYQEVRLREGGMQTVPQTAAIELANAGLRIAFLREIDATECDRQNSALAQEIKAGSKGCVTVFDSLTSFYRSGESHDIVLLSPSLHRRDDRLEGAISHAQTGNPESIVVHFEWHSRERSVAPLKAIPIVIDRSALAYSFAHLRSVVRMLPPRVPIKMRGLDLVSNLYDHVTGEGDLSGRHLDFRIDGPEEDGANPARSVGIRSADGALFLDREPAFSEREETGPVNLEQIPNHRAVAARVLHDPAGLRILRFGIPSPEDGNPGHTMRWTGRDGMILAEKPLSHLDKLLLVHRRRVRGVTMTSMFSPSSVRVEAQPPRIDIEATAFRDNGADLIFPRFQMEWSPTPAEQASVPRFDSIPREWGVMWLDSEELSLGTATFRLIEHGNRYDQTVPFVPELGFETPASSKFLILCPPIDKAPEPDALAALAQAKWSVHSPDFMPETTFAMHAWLEREIPGISLFGKVLAFRLPSECTQLGKAVLVFVEPVSTGHTLSQTVQLLMKRRESVDRFFDAIDALLETGFTKAPPERLAQFWLPQTLRKAGSWGERDVYEAWLRQRYGEGGRYGEEDDSLDIAYEYLCTYCGNTLSGTSRWGRGAFRLKCCRSNDPVAILATTNDKRFAPVHALLTPWAPQESLPPVPPDPLQAVLALWRLVAENTRYRFDHHSKDGVRDCWLEPAEMWKRGVGDCEDHSILLVSLIRKLVKDLVPWLVLGDLKGAGYHAWVMVQCQKTGREYLIEATRKSIPKALESVDSAEHGNYAPEWRCNGTIYQQRTEGKWVDWIGVSAEAEN